MISGRAKLAAAAAICVLATPEAGFAQVRDATYKGALDCASLPFVKGYLRSAMDVSISGREAKYKRPVLDPEHGTVLGEESGSGAVEGDSLKLSGAWRGPADRYEASYSGPLKGRSFMISGTQTWTHDGKTFTRACSGVIKRPFAVFLKKRGT